MKFKTPVGSLALLGSATHALAQSGEQRVVITGSSIKRIAVEGALPLQVITRAELTREGIGSTEQLVMSLASNGTGLDNLASNADVVDGAQRGNNGATSANLRGQGSNATLVLLNGRRVASHGLNGGVVDLNQIPFAAIERIEILKDGASAIYGTDAVGGVINFITRRDFTGFTTEAFVDVTEQGGGNICRGAVTGGFRTSATCWTSARASRPTRRTAPARSASARWPATSASAGSTTCGSPTSRATGRARSASSSARATATAPRRAWRRRWPAAARCRRTGRPRSTTTRCTTRRSPTPG